MNCFNCQSPISEGEKFCGKCGSPVKKYSSLEVFLLKMLLFIGFIMEVELLLFSNTPGSFYLGLVLAGSIGFVFAKIQREIKLRTVIALVALSSFIILNHFFNDLLSPIIMIAIVSGVSILFLFLGKRSKGSIAKNIAIFFLGISFFLFIFSTSISLNGSDGEYNIEIMNDVAKFLRGCGWDTRIQIGISGVLGEARCSGLKIDKTTGGLRFGCYGAVISERARCSDW